MLVLTFLACGKPEGPSEVPCATTSFYPDADGDGFGDDLGLTAACEAPTGHVTTPGDCDDDDAQRSPAGKETCDGVDNDCDGAADEDAADTALWYADVDGVGWGEGEAVSACAAPDGHVARPGDCDGASADTHPEAPELCDGLDNDCDLETDEEFVEVPWFLDADGDGYGDIEDRVQSCAPVEGRVTNAQDCDDARADAYPGGAEVEADGVDQDCDGWDAGADSDGDGLSDEAEAEIHGTDPALADTDGDGWDDGAEIASTTDPSDSTDHPYTGGWSIDSCRSSIASTGTAVGDIAPNFALGDQYGDTVRLHDFCGKVVLLDNTSFW